jgi:hypothetical protein
MHTTTTTTTTFTTETTPMPMTAQLTTPNPHRSNAMPTTTTTRRRSIPSLETTPMPNAMHTASLVSAPANDITASPRCGHAVHPRRTSMPIALAVSTPNPLITRQNSMGTALTLKVAKTTPTLTLVHSVSVNKSAHSNAATSQRAPRPPAALPEEVTLLRASQVDSVAAHEIEFFFTNDSEDRAAVQARAVIASWIAELAPRDLEALALYYEPEPWPESILDEGLDYSSGYALVLSRASASAWRPNRRRQFAAEQIANEQLCAAVLKRGPRALRHLTRRAEWDFATALRAYARTRGRAPSVLARLARASLASEES